MNGLNKCPKFEKKFERERTANFCFCPSNVSHNLGRNNQIIREISSHCDKNSSHNIEANTDEYPYYVRKLKHFFIFKEPKDPLENLCKILERLTRLDDENKFLKNRVDFLGSQQL